MKEPEIPLREMIDKIPALAWSCRPDGTAEFLNQRWIDYTGLSPEEAVGWGWQAAIHSEDLGKLMDTWLRLLATGEPGEEEARLRRFDGAYHWFLFRAVPIRNEQGKVIRWYGTNTDIEERRRGEEAQKRTRDRIIRQQAATLTLVKAPFETLEGTLHRITEMVADTLAVERVSIWTFNEARTEIQCRDLFHLAERRHEQGVTLTVTQYPRYFAALEESLTIAAEHARVDQRTSEFTEGYLSVLGISSMMDAPIRHGAMTLGVLCHEHVGAPREWTLDEQNFAGSIADLVSLAFETAERKRAEEKLRQEERELRRITDAIPQLITVLGPDGNVLYANQLVLDYSGLGLEDVMAEDFRTRLFHHDDLERVRKEGQHALERGAPFELELRARRKDGQYRWFLVRYNPFRDEEGHIIRWYATGTDIEDRKRAEERVQKENLALREEIDHSALFEEIVGSSEALREVMAQVAIVASADSTVLVLGETGTGKELLARAIHNRSERRGRTLVKMNCAAIPTGLLESELFGHEKGAFTGAIGQKIGRFELADGGTLFLDEVGEIPLELQVKLLRVLQEQEFERLGSTRTIRVNVRIVAATNRDLARLVQEKAFRDDLYYRLNVFPITMPPLRERPQDIPMLTRHFAQKFAQRMKKRIETVPMEAMKALQNYPWPGNVRELGNLIERAVILTQGTDLFVPLTELKRAPKGSNDSPVTLEQAEREHILKVLRGTNWVIGGSSGASAKLGIKRTTLQSKMQKLGISRPS